MSPPLLRIARPTNDLTPLVRFYRDGLGLAVRGGFDDHAGFDGVMLGDPACPWHLEFTRERGVVAPRANSPEHLLVFYFAEPAAWAAAVARLAAIGARRVVAHNPWWERAGATFEDPDGWRVVLQQGTWPAE